MKAVLKAWKIYPYTSWVIDDSIVEFAILQGAHHHLVSCWSSLLVHPAYKSVRTSHWHWNSTHWLNSNILTRITLNSRVTIDIFITVRRIRCTSVFLVLENFFCSFQSISQTLCTPLTSLFMLCECPSAPKIVAACACVGGCGDSDHLINLEQLVKNHT